MKIAIITPRARKTGGAEESLFELIKYLKSKNHEILLISREDSGSLLEESTKLGVKCFHFYFDLWVNLSWEKNVNNNIKFQNILTQAINIYNFLKGEKVDLIYTNTAVTNVGAMVSTFLNVPHIWHIRESIIDNPTYTPIVPQNDIANYINSSSSRVIYISNYLKDIYTKEIVNENSTVITNRIVVENQNLKPIKEKRKVDVVIPFYKDDSILECLESVLKHKSPHLDKVYVIFDKGPDLELRERVETWIKKHNDLFVYLENEENLGFVKNCNRGMKLSSANDVILLNSDTVVTSNWIDKLRTNVYQDDNICMSTSLSNSASYYSVPDQFNKEFENNPEIVNKALELFSPYKYIETHATHGYCTYIKRSLLNDIGYFDEDNFGKGYGEEVDLSMRALNKGYRIIVSTNMYIHHWEGRSFDVIGEEKKKIIKERTKVLIQRYPNLHVLEKQFHERNQLVDIKKIVNYFKTKDDEVFNSNRLVVLGSIEENKGQIDAIELINTLNKTKDSDKYHLLLIGEYDVNSDYYTKILELIKKYKLEEYIHFLGFIDNPFEIIKSSKAMINASRSEGFGRSAFEAMLLKVPLISTTVGGLSDFVDETTAYTFNASDLNSLKKAFDELLNDNDKKRVDKAFKFSSNLQLSSNYGEDIEKYLLELGNKGNSMKGIGLFFTKRFLNDLFNPYSKNFLKAKLKAKLMQYPVLYKAVKLVKR